MKHLVIRNFGPLKEADIELSNLNLIIGRQSSGKSCALKIACYCTWVEKRILLSQTHEPFLHGGFLSKLLRYHKMKGFERQGSYIAYATPYVEFSYDYDTDDFKCKIKAMMKYKRPKVSYIPSDRNLVAAIPNWGSLTLDADNILDFMADWDVARRFVKRERNILGLGVTYEYDESANEDMIRVSNSKKALPFTNGSSGLQSMLPIYVHMDYLTHGIYSYERAGKKRSYGEKEQEKNLLNTLYRQYVERGLDQVTPDSAPVVYSYDGQDYLFGSQKAAEKFSNDRKRFFMTNHCEVFLEEPEDNLFPPTQCQLLDWLMENLFATRRKNELFVATHSPYVLTHLLEKKIDDLKLFFTYMSTEDGLYSIKTATKEELHEIYDNGVDMFFNFESYVE